MRQFEKTFWATFLFANFVYDSLTLWRAAAFWDF